MKTVFHFFNRFTALSCTATLLLSAGCSQTDDDRIAVFPVSGVITVEGKPAEGAEVVLYGDSPELSGKGTVIPSGTTDTEGRFVLRSYDPGDGAPAGTYRVSVHWPEPIPPGADEEMFEPKDRLNEKYLDPKTSEITLQVPEGGGELPPIEL